MLVIIGVKMALHLKGAEPFFYTNNVLQRKNMINEIV